VTKTYWLSFVDEHRPAGERFLGVCIVEVTEADAAAVRPRLPPQAQPGAEWIAAAMRKAWRLGCNPGGTVASYELPGSAPASAMNRLLSADEARAIEAGLWPS
jgi:hypothetical protein